MIKLCGDYIAMEAVVSLGFCLVKYALEIRAVDHHYIRADIDNSLYGTIIFRKRCYPAVLSVLCIISGDHYIACKVIFRCVYALGNYCYIRAVFFVVFYYVAYVYITYHVAIRKHDIILVAAVYKIHYAEKGFKSRCIELCRCGVLICGNKRRQYLYTSRAAGEVPVLTGAYMVEERLIIIVSDDTYLGYIGIHHI